MHTITTDVQQSADGYEVWLNVQAVDAHEHRVAEMAKAFDAYLVLGSWRYSGDYALTQHEHPSLTRMFTNFD